MKKHFLILMLMALLPLAGWSAISITTPAALNDGVDYDGNAKQVIKTALEATAEGTLTISYAVNTTGVEPAADAADTWYQGIDNAALKVNGAGTYYAYYKIESTNGGEGTVIDGITGTFAIAKVAATVATAPTAKDLTYSAANQDLVNAGTSLTGTLKYNLIGGDNPDDYNAAIPQATNAGEYTVYYMVAGDGNHNNLIAPATQKVTVNIAKKNLKAKAVAFTADKTIFGVFKQTEAVAIEYDGFVGDDWYETTGTKVSVFTGTYAAPTAEINATVKANDNTVTIGTTKYIKAGNYPEALEVTGGTAANYEIICLNNDLNISKAKIKVDLIDKPANAVFGSAAAAKTEWPIAWADRNTYLSVKRQETATTYTDVAAADFAAVLKTRTTTEPAATYFNSEVKMTRANTSTDKGEYLLALSGVEATENTEILEQTNSGELKFEITAAVLTIKASNKWKTYGTADPKETDGSWAYTVKAAGVAYDGLNDAQNAAIKAGLTRAAGETAGDYKISFSADLKTNELFAGNYTITWTDGWLTIEKADLTITAKPQTLYKGNKVDKLVQTEYRVDGLVTNADLSIADAAEVSLAFGTVNTDGVETLVPVSDEEGHVGELTAVGQPYLYGIKVVLANAEALAENYNITLVNGALTVVNLDDAIVLSFAADNTEALETAHDKRILVTFTEKELQIGEWYAMVLPFEVDPLKMVAAFDRYVIFNELNTFATTDGNFKFTLRLDPIPAGTPFLIKFAPKTGDAEDAVVNLATDFTSATYGTVKISKNVTPVETDYVIFDGTYQGGKVLQGLKDDNGGEKVWWLADKTYANGAGWKKPKSNPHTLNPMEAYLTAEGKTWTSYSPVITVEDFDGQVTSIKTLTSDKVNNLNVMTDGWYTVGGIKLQGAPTQKGIYIQNGKKVVVK